MKLLQLLLLGLSASCIFAVDEWMYKFPENCNVHEKTSCTYKAKWIVKKDVVVFTIVAKQELNTWTGIAFSNTTELQEAEVIYGCINRQNQGTIFDGWWTNLEVAPTKDDVQVIRDTSITYSDGLMHLIFTHPRITNQQNETSFSDNDCYYVHYPVQGGKCLNNEGLIEKPHDTPKKSTQSVCFPLTEDDVTGVTPSIMTMGMPDREHKRVCYYSTLAQHRVGDDKCEPKDIDPTLCNYLTLAYANISMEHTLIPTDPKDIETNGLYDKFTQLKNTNPDVKMLLAVGGKNLGKEETKEMLKSTDTRGKFITSVLETLNKHKFDGCSIDFLNLGTEEKTLLTELIKEMQKKFEEKIITITVSGTKENLENVDLIEVSKHVEFINIEAYNLVNESIQVTAHHSALHPNPNLPNAENNTEWVVKYCKEKGVPMKKLILGMPVFGRESTLENANNHGIGAPIVGPGPMGSCTNEEGVVCYYEVCKLLTDSSVTKVELKSEKVIFLVKDTRWIAIDDQTTLRNKVEWLKKQGCGGWMVSMTDFDDFNGKHCNQGRFPLIRTLYETLIGGVTGIVTPLTKILTSTTRKP